MDETVVITGCNGWVGSRVAAEALRRGYRVVAIQRTQTSFDPRLRIRVADLARDSFLEMGIDPLVQSAKAIIHCAGIAHRPRESPETNALFDNVNRRGTERMLEVAKVAGIPRIVYVSSIAVYDWESGSNYDEDGPVAPSTAYGVSKLAGEHVCRRSGLDCRIARLATVFGYGDRANFAALAVALARRRFAMPGSGEAAKSVLPIETAANVLLDLASRDYVPRETVNVALPISPTLREICDSFSAVCRFPRAPSIPTTVLAGIAAIGDAVGWIYPSFGVNTRNLRKLMTSTAVNTSRLNGMWLGYRWPTLFDSLVSCGEFYVQISGAVK